MCVTVNFSKTPMFTLEERMELIERVVKRLKNVRVDTSDILIAEYAKKYEHAVLVRGLRAVSDYESEVQMAIINNKINRKLDTIFIPSSEKYTYLSSTAVKEMAKYGTDLKNFVPREIIDDVINKTQANRR